MAIPLLSRLMRKRRMALLIDAIELHEGALRDACAALIELTDPDDDLHLEVQRLLEALDG